MVKDLISALQKYQSYTSIRIKWRPGDLWISWNGMFCGITYEINRCNYEKKTKDFHFGLKVKTSTRVFLLNTYFT